MKNSKHERVSRRPTVLLPTVTKVDDFCVNVLAQLRENINFSTELSYYYVVRGYDHRTSCLRYSIFFVCNYVSFLVNAYVSTKLNEVTYPQIHRPFSVFTLLLEINNYFKV